jgi:hypothetical protein
MNPTIGLEDFQTIKTLIQAVSERGAIKAEEMQTVGALYVKITAFIEAMNRALEEAKKAPAPPNTEQPTAPVQAAAPEGSNND